MECEISIGLPHLAPCGTTWVQGCVIVVPTFYMEGKWTSFL